MDGPHAFPGPRTASVAPPSFIPSPSAAPVPPPPAAAPSPVAAGLDPDGAIRARLNAAFLDSIIVGVLVRVVLLPVLGVTVVSGDAVLVVLGLEFLYFFGLEYTRGQTLGKRVMNIRVVALDGTAPSARACALRNVLRFVDAVPLLYASGLISLIRTGRGRRQRIGDVAARTTVVVGDGGRRLRTPGWLLPVATLVAAALSIAAFVLVVQARDRAAATQGGVARVSSQAPIAGTWAATGVVTASSDPTTLAGQRMFRWWHIARTCAAPTCGYTLTRQIAGAPLLSAPLVHESDGWHATFPDRTYTCQSVSGASATTVLHSTWLVLFDVGGTDAAAREENVYGSQACGTTASTVVWSATLTRGPWPPQS